MMTLSILHLLDIQCKGRKSIPSRLRCSFLDRQGDALEGISQLANLLVVWFCTSKIESSVSQNSQSGSGTEIKEMRRKMKASITNINMQLHCFGCISYALLSILYHVYLRCKFSMVSSISNSNLTWSRCLGGEWTISHHFLLSTLALTKEEQSNKITKARRSSSENGNDWDGGSHISQGQQRAA